jgi:hypothetical protein
LCFRQLPNLGLKPLHEWLVPAAAEPLEERFWIEWVPCLPQLQHGKPTQEFTVEEI